VLVVATLIALTLQLAIDLVCAAIEPKLRQL
jgi:hypothetical protein